ncbi:hypothetical protein GCM10027569_46890 [Flindersiella endophytica]
MAYGLGPGVVDDDRRDARQVGGEQSGDQSFWIGVVKDHPGFGNDCGLLARAGRQLAELDVATRPGDRQAIGLGGGSADDIT